jgi:SAM-dependent MidA family methyltransferase
MLDAMPVKRFWIDSNGEAKELGIRHENGNYEWHQTTEALGHKDQERLSAYGLPAGYRSEIAAQAEAWVRTIAEHLDKGVMLLVDYGFPGREFYHRDRVDGTVMCHYRHTAHPDPFFYPGLQDITSHVDFTAIADAALESGLELAGYCTQGSYLISLGLLDNHAAQFDPAQPTRESLSMAQEIKKLTLPHEMGELFKVVAFSRHYPMPLSGFSMQNLAARL